MDFAFVAADSVLCLKKKKINYNLTFNNRLMESESKQVLSGRENAYLALPLNFGSVDGL